MTSCQSDLFIDAYTDQQSYFPGDTSIVYINIATAKEKSSINLYNLKGEIVATQITDLFPQSQNSDQAWAKGFGYQASFAFIIPDLPSGIYSWENKAPFIIKSKKPTAPIVLVYASNTENAYNNAGGKSLYNYNSSDEVAAHKVSFLRPTQIERFSEAFLKWIVHQEYAVDYICDSDLENYSAIASAKIVLIPGHSEYWTKAARLHFDRFVQEGGDALVLSGNTMWWQVRYANNKKEVICYKKEKLDPHPDTLMQTVRWENPILKYPILNSIGADFGRGGYGLKKDQGWNGYRITAANSPLLKNTNLENGDILYLPTTEYDGTPIHEFAPNNYPILNPKDLGVHRLELIGFDFGQRANKKTVGTFFVLQQKPNSGIIINTGSTDWCSKKGIGGKSGKTIKTITNNMIQALLKDQSVFSKN